MEKQSWEVFQTPYRPWWLPHSRGIRVVGACIVVWFAIQLLMNLGAFGRGPEPWILGIPFPLFVNFIVTLAATVITLNLNRLWPDFPERAEDALRREGEGGR
jgi:fumarate reductase subunit C